MEALVPVVLALLAGLGFGSLRVTSSSRSMLVERLGKYNRQLSPGLSLVLPGIERVVSHESLKERVLDIPPQQCITRDNVSIEVDAVVYWQLLEHARAYYAVDNLQAAMVNVVLTQIRAEMGKLDLDQTFTTRSETCWEALVREDEYNRVLLTIGVHSLVVGEYLVIRLEITSFADKRAGVKA